MKKIFIIGGSIILALIIVVSLTSKKSKTHKVSVEEVSKREIVEIVSSSGKLFPEEEVKISPDVSGEIIELAVAEGDTVVKGQLLCRINPELYESSLQQMKASLNNSQAGLASSQAQALRVKASFRQQEENFKRQEKLYKDQVISKSEFEAAEAAFLMAKAEYSAAEQSVEAARFNVQISYARLDEAMKNFGRTSLYAPKDGVVVGLNRKKGERVVGTNMMEGTEIMRIANLSLMEVRVDVSENDIIRINRGDSVNIEVDAYRNRKFKGVVREVARSMKNSATVGQSTDQPVNFEVKISIIPSSYEALAKEIEKHPFWPGMTASVDIVTRIEKDVLCAPISAVSLRDKESLEGKIKSRDEGDPDSYRDDDELAEEGLGDLYDEDSDSNQDYDDEKSEGVFVVNADNTVTFRKVKTGIQDSKYIQILSGLKEGDKVVSGPYYLVNIMLQNGAGIEIVDRKQLFETEKK
jgi:HlyD family secretion protein